MNKQEIDRILTLQRPITNDSIIWNMYWERQGQPWRTQPEINSERQKYLEKRRYCVFEERELINPLKDV